MHAHWHQTPWNRMAPAMPSDADLIRVAFTPQPRWDFPTLPWRTP